MSKAKYAQHSVSIASFSKMCRLKLSRDVMVLFINQVRFQLLKEKA